MMDCKHCVRKFCDTKKEALDMAMRHIISLPERTVKGIEIQENSIGFQTNWGSRFYLYQSVIG